MCLLLLFESVEPKWLADRGLGRDGCGSLVFSLLCLHLEQVRQIRDVEISNARCYLLSLAYSRVILVSESPVRYSTRPISSPRQNKVLSTGQNRNPHSDSPQIVSTTPDKSLRNTKSNDTI